ncbi:hypothetical protein [Neomesorhizobium albiziae]|uniref:hypothetical protein n=1 Tax=Neomesorhizobium albiziae TaxID=335020 RepID=UPI001FCE3002|nr:hypothetical protein [Mesorhizobium albiziae]
MRKRQPRCFGSFGSVLGSNTHSSGIRPCEGRFRLEAGERKRHQCAMQAAVIVLKDTLNKLAVMGNGPPRPNAGCRPAGRRRFGSLRNVAGTGHLRPRHDTLSLEGTVTRVGPARHSRKIGIDAFKGESASAAPVARSSTSQGKNRSRRASMRP